MDALGCASVASGAYKQITVVRRQRTMVYQFPVHSVGVSRINTDVQILRAQADSGLPRHVRGMLGRMQFLIPLTPFRVLRCSLVFTALPRFHHHWAKSQIAGLTLRQIAGRFVVSLLV